MGRTLRVTRLENGLRIITEGMPAMSSVSLGVWFGVGSRYEVKEMAGVSHFLEHLLFKGTRRRSAKQITEEIEGIGGIINAFTGEEHTCYVAKIHHLHVSKGLEILSDMILNSAFDPVELQRERAVIQEEQRMAKDNPGEYAQELLGRLLWPGQALGRLVMGNSATVRAMTRSQIMAFKARHYVSGNMVVAGAGNLAHEKLVRLVRRWFARMPVGNPTAFDPAVQDHRGPVAAMENQKTQQVHVALGLPGYSRSHPDRAVLRVLSVLLGGNMSSRLFQEVREKKGLAYDIGSSVQRYHDAGMLLMYVGTESSKLLSCMEIIGKVLRGFKKGDVRREELRKAKEFCIGSLTLLLEKTMDRMLWLGETLISLNEIPDRQKMIREIQHVSLSDVVRVAREIFQRDALCLAAIGRGMSARKLLARLAF